MVYDEVLVPLDGSARSASAVAAADTLAAVFGCEVNYLTVAADNGRLEQRRAGCTEHVPAARLEGLVGEDVAATIIQRADGSGKASLICLASHGRGRVSGLVLGSVAEALLRQRAAPVVLVGPEFDKNRFRRLSRLVIAVDGSQRSEQALSLADSWAQALPLRLDVITVLRTSVDRSKAGAGGGDTHESSYVRVLAKTALSSGERNWEVLSGDNPATAINDYAKRLPGSLVALTTHGRGGLDRLRLGSVATRIVHHSAMPLLVQRSLPPES